jgi:hypothetical protein
LGVKNFGAPKIAIDFTNRPTTILSLMYILRVNLQVRFKEI